MKRVTPTELKENLDELLDEVLSGGAPVEIRIGDRRLMIIDATRPDKFQNLVRRPDVIKGDPEDLVSLSWTPSSSP